MYKTKNDDNIFYKYLAGVISSKELEQLVYRCSHIENVLPRETYFELISYNFESNKLYDFVLNIVKSYCDIDAFEKYRTIELLNSIVDGELDFHSAATKLYNVFNDQCHRLKIPIISKELGLQFWDLLDVIPKESEYKNWNKDALKEQLEEYGNPEEKLFELAKKELSILSEKRN
ncbi:MAG: hypothetical protein ACE364_07240 [Chlorobiota bacterium]